MQPRFARGPRATEDLPRGWRATERIAYQGWDAMPLECWVHLPADAAIHEMELSDTVRVEVAAQYKTRARADG